MDTLKVVESGAIVGTEFAASSELRRATHDRHADAPA
jgi:hypothetical protein